MIGATGEWAGAIGKTAGAVWKLRKDIFAPEFVAYVDSLLKEFEAGASR
jgi:hypothetical protein